MKSKKKKTELKFFTIAQWKKEQEYLREMHQKGWKFTGTNMFICYHFERCAPEDVIYQLDYNPEGMENQEEYTRMFEDCGWEYVQNFFGYSYFRKPRAKMDGEEEIFCDDDSRLDMMKRVFRGRLKPMTVIFFFCIIPFLTMRIWDGLWISPLTWTYMILFVLYIAVFGSMGLQYWKLLKK